MFALVKLLRPHQWLKNAFVFAGIVFSHQWQNTVLLQEVFITAIAFCLLSSTMYIFNDIVDRNTDRTHPLKRNRPLAAGDVHLMTAIFLAILLGVSAFTLSFFVTTQVTWILLAYVFLNIAYSCWLKQCMILDVFVISAGFLLRILAGTDGVGIAPSGWLLLCSLMLTLFLGFNKRRSERQAYINANITLPKILEHYGSAFLDKLITITATTTILGYTFYCLQQDNLLHQGTHHFIYTVPLVMYGIFRYLYLTDSKPYGGLDMAQDLLHDLPLLSTIFVWFMVIIVLGL